jgi:hypothetical protein
MRDGIRDILVGHFVRCNFNPVPPAYDQAFDDLVLQYSDKSGWDTKKIHSALIAGANIAITTYRHIESLDTKIYIAVYTGLAIVVDDMCSKDAKFLQGASEFIQVSACHYAIRRPMLTSPSSASVASRTTSKSSNTSRTS